LLASFASVPGRVRQPGETGEKHINERPGRAVAEKPRDPAPPDAF